MHLPILSCMVTEISISNVESYIGNNTAKCSWARNMIHMSLHNVEGLVAHL